MKRKTNISTIIFMLITYWNNMLDVLTRLLKLIPPVSFYILTWLLLHFYWAAPTWPVGPFLVPGVWTRGACPPAVPWNVPRPGHVSFFTSSSNPFISWDLEVGLQAQWDSGPRCGVDGLPHRFLGVALPREASATHLLVPPCNFVSSPWKGLCCPGAPSPQWC